MRLLIYDAEFGKPLQYFAGLTSNSRANPSVSVFMCSTSVTRAADTKPLRCKPENLDLGAASNGSLGLLHN